MEIRQPLSKALWYKKRIAERDLDEEQNPVAVLLVSLEDEGDSRATPHLRGNVF